MPMCSLLGTVFVLNELMSRERNECLGDHLETFFLSKKIIIYAVFCLHTDRGH